MAIYIYKCFTFESLNLRKGLSYQLPTIINFGVLPLLLDLDIPAGSYLDFEPLGVLCLVTSARSKGKTPKSIFVERSGVARSVRNRKLI